MLAIGEVVEPGYEWRPERSEYQHMVRVDWDTSYATDIPEQKRWAFATVAKLSFDLYETIVRDRPGKLVRAPVPPLFQEIAEALGRKGQLILYGPPGTGKTWSAWRFAFVELMPDVELLHGGKVGRLFLNEFLTELNRRVAESVGREKQIGHSFLLDGEQPVTDMDAFARRFRQEILPLLQEYSYDDYAALERFLRSGLVDRERQSLNADRFTDAESLLTALEDEFMRAEEEPV